MRFLEGHLVDVQFKDEWYNKVACVGSDANYLYCMERDGTARLFNHNYVKQIVCGVNKPEPERKPEPEVEMESNGSYESQANVFRLDEMRERTSNMDFGVSQDMGVIDPRG